LKNVLELRGVSKRFGGFTALEGIDLSVARGERLGLIGPNGSGKSTLVNCICGATGTDAGTIIYNGEDISRLAPHERARRGLVRTFQLPRPFSTLTVLENIRIPLLFTLHDRQSARANAGEIDERCRQFAESVGLGGKEDLQPANLTQVEMRKLELARAMAAEPQLLIADESMAGLSDLEVAEILSLLLRLNAQGVTIIMIEHIMKAVLEFSQRLVVLVSGKKIADGEPEDVFNDVDVQRVYLGQ
jgi:branched-chain amino acid transport system ATP-binding protein